jgi:hypothetical protein
MVTADQVQCSRKKATVRGDVNLSAWAGKSHLIYLVSVDARMSVQNTLYLVFGA